MLVEILNDCRICEGTVTGISSLNHCTKGKGLPVASQYSVAKLPT